MPLYVIPTKQLDHHTSSNLRSKTKIFSLRSTAIVLVKMYVRTFLISLVSIAYVPSSHALIYVMCVSDTVPRCHT